MSWAYVLVSLILAWFLSRPLLGTLEDVRIHTSPRKHIFLFLLIAIVGVVIDRLTIIHFGRRPNLIIPLAFASILTLVGVQMVYRSLRYRNQPLDH
jgi:hypothetical protein